MKKIITLALSVLLALSLFCTAALAATASATLTGPTTVRAGDTITLTFKLNGKNLSGVEGKLTYDTSKLEYKGFTQKISTPWMVEFNDEFFVAYDNNLEKPISKTTTLFTVKFKVKSNVATGSKISVSFTNLLASDGSDIMVSNATYSATIAAPMSTDCSLKALSASNATLSPAFSSKVTSYTAEVPFEVEKLDLKATANHSKAKVTVDNPTLMPGGTTDVNITVTAENGEKKTYTVTVKRAQDPNYIPSGDNALASISVDGFLLSPAFLPDMLQYVVWLPYETESISVSAAAAHPLASVSVVGGEALEPGEDNEIQVICTAENGETQIYTVIAKRAAPHQVPTEPPLPTDPTESVPPTEPSEPISPTETTEPSVPAETQPVPTQPPAQLPALPAVNQPMILIVAAALCLLLGFFVGFLLGRKR